MKKIIIFVVGFMMCIAMSGCQGESHEKEIRASVDGYMSAIKEGNYTKALESTVGIDKLQDNFGFKDLKKLPEKFFDEIETTEDMNKELEEFINYMIQNSIKEYTIDKVIEKENEAIVEISGKCINFEQMDTQSNKIDIMKISQDYAYKNRNELTKIYTEKGEEAVKQKVMEDITPIIFDSMKKTIDEIPLREFKMQMTLTSKENQWLISGLDELEV